MRTQKKKKSTITIPEYSSLQNTPTNPFILTWENLDLKITIKKSSKLCSKKTKQLHILKNQSGFAKSGECLAIMGGSGAGKSTLLNILSGQFEIAKNMKMEGSVKLNQKKMEWKVFKNIIGFVMQNDLFLETMKVEELFKFVVDLRKVGVSEKKKQDLVNKILIDLKLEKTRKNIVGGNFNKGISGGEKRRLNIGFELLRDPKILFLDEPTSGLDSYTGFIIVKLLKKLAKEKNMIIIYTIHQPSIDIGNLFDKLLILNKGKISYFGERKNIEKYYEELGYYCPININPLDYVIDIALIGGSEADEKFFSEFENKGISSKIKTTIKNAPNTFINPKIKKANSLKQFQILSKKSFKNFIRNPLTFKIRLIQILFISIIFMLLFWQLPTVTPNKKTSIQNRTGALFFISINFFILYFQTTLTTFPAEREIFLKEYNAGLYGIIPYFLSKIIIEIPLTSFFPFLFTAITYYAVNFNNGVSNFFFLLLEDSELRIVERLWACLLGLLF